MYQSDSIIRHHYISSGLVEGDLIEGIEVEVEN